MPSGVYIRTKEMKTGKGWKPQGLTFLGRKHTPEALEKMRVGNVGKKRSKTMVSFLKTAFLGKKHTPETRIKMSLAQKKRVLDGKNHLWRGGLSSINKQIRNSIDYKFWRESVFRRDNWTCVECGQIGGQLNADHIKPFAYYPELRFAIDNGRTLCVECHKETETYLKQQVHA